MNNATEWHSTVEQVLEIYWHAISRQMYTGWDKGRYVAAPLSFEIGQMRHVKDGNLVPMFTSHRGRLAMILRHVAAVQHQYSMQSRMAAPE